MSNLELALLAQVLLFLMVTGAFLATRQASLFHPLTFYLGFHGLVFVARPLLIHHLNFDAIWLYMRWIPTDGDLIRGLVVSSAGMLAFSIPCLWVGWSKPRFVSARPEPLTKAQWRGLILTTALLLPLALYSMHSYMSGGMQGEHIGGVFVMQGASGYTLEAQNMAGALMCAWMAATRFHRLALVPLALYVAARAYQGEARWSFVLLFLALSALYAWQHRSKWLPWWTVVLAIPLLLLFKSLGENRDFLAATLEGRVIEQTVEPMTQAEKMRAKWDSQEFANFDYLCFVVNMVPARTETFTYGTQYLQLFTEPIPRKLWPGKPIGAPIGFFNLNNYGNFLGLTPSLPGDGWMSGGWLGLVITMGLVGAVLGRTHRRFWRHSNDTMFCLFYIIGLAMLPQWYRDGGISISKFLFWNFLPLLVWLGMSWLCGPRLVPAYSYVLPRGASIRVLPNNDVHRGRDAGADTAPTA